MRHHAALAAVPAVAAHWPLIALWGSVLAFVASLWLLAAFIVDVYADRRAADREGDAMTVPVDLAALAAEAHANAMRLVDELTAHAQRYADLVQRLNEHGPDLDDADGPEWEAFNDRSGITAYKGALLVLAELAVALRDDDTPALLELVIDPD